MHDKMVLCMSWGSPKKGSLLSAHEITSWIMSGIGTETGTRSSAVHASGVGPAYHNIHSHTSYAQCGL